MSATEKSANEFIGYEYKEILVDDKLSLYLDGYENFGWIIDENVTLSKGLHQKTLKLKRNRKIINKTELTRLQRHFESCISELQALEKEKTSLAICWAIGIGLLGTAFIAGSVFAVTHEPPIIWLCILLAIPGFGGWISPNVVYNIVKKRQTVKLTPLIEAKYDEIYDICEKGNSLL